jgi:hypothetical protein
MFGPESPSNPRSARSGPSGVLCAPTGAGVSRSPYRTVWDELGYLHDHPTTGERFDDCRGCLERASESHSQ